MGTIKSTREIDRIFRGARRVSTTLMTALIAATPEGRGPEGRVAFVAGKKLGGAVLRNRCKRVLRETVRRSGGPWPGHDVVLISRAGLDSAPASSLDACMREIVRRGGLER